MKRIITSFVAMFASLVVLIMPVYADQINENRAKEQADAIAQEFQGKEYVGTFSISREDGVRIEFKKDNDNNYTFEVVNTEAGLTVSYPTIVEHKKLNISIEQSSIINTNDATKMLVIISILIIIVFIIVFIIVTGFLQSLTI